MSETPAPAPPGPLDPVRFSEIRAWKWCRRNWYNAYYLGLAPKGGEFNPDRAPSTAQVGTYVHASLEAFYLGLTPTPQARHLGTEVPTGGEAEAEWKAAHDLARIMLEGYGEWLAEEGHDQGEQTLGCEVELTTTISPDLPPLTVHIDRIVHDTSFDRIIIEDTKTVDQLAKGQDFAVEEQLLTYLVAARTTPHFQDAAYARHNMLRRVKRTARATPPFYARAEIRPSQEQLAATEAQLRGVLREISDARLRLQSAGPDHRYPQGLLYPNPGRDCGWRCKFLPICAAHDDGSDVQALRAELYEPYDTNRHKAGA